MIYLEKVTDKNRLWNIFQKYMYEMTQFYDDIIMGEDGNYPYPYFDSYFEGDPERKAFFIMDDDLIVGFVLIYRHSFIGNNIDYAIAEFTVFPAYRKRSCGSEAMKCVFDRFPGQWEIRYSLKNHKAVQFWTKVTQPFEPKVVNLEDEEQLVFFSTNTNGFQRSK